MKSAEPPHGIADIRRRERRRREALCGYGAPPVDWQALARTACSGKVFVLESGARGRVIATQPFGESRSDIGSTTRTVCVWDDAATADRRPREETRTLTPSHQRRAARTVRASAGPIADRGRAPISHDRGRTRRQLSTAHGLRRLRVSAGQDDRYSKVPSLLRRFRVAWLCRAVVGVVVGLARLGHCGRFL